MDTVLQSFKDAVFHAIDSGQKICIKGGGTKEFYGGSAVGERLDTRAYTGIIEYDPGELVLRVRSGTTLATIESVLAEHNQLLPFDPPFFSENSTIGGAVAAGLCGPLRLANGAMRDHVLGMTMMDGRGDVLTFGGKVIKNVAGYDVSRLMAGSMGTLGILLDITVKLLPRPAEDLTLCLRMSQEDAILRMNQLAGIPASVISTAWWNDVLYLRLGGAKSAVTQARKAIGGEILDNLVAAKFWKDLRDQRNIFFKAGQHARTLWRVSVPGTTPPLQAGDAEIIEWSGQLRWIYSDLPANLMRQRVAAAGGHATQFRNPDREFPIFDELSAPVLAVNQRLKDAFDPHRIFNSKRLHSSF